MPTWLAILAFIFIAFGVLLLYLRRRITATDIARINAWMLARNKAVELILPVTAVGRAQWWRERNHPGGARRYEVTYRDGAGATKVADVRTGYGRDISLETRRN
jgi:hypothetical protein